MRFVIQRVSQASVMIEHKDVHNISKGLVVLVGICNDDTWEISDKMIRKLLNLRIFEDENGKTNLSLTDVSGELLIVSQFTLYADCKKGNRPSFTNAGSPEHANKLYEYIVSECKTVCIRVETGSFGAHMEVGITNDGPFTIVLDSEQL